MTDDERVAIMDLADELQVRKQRIFKLLPRLGIRPVLRREPNRGNQNVATVSIAESGLLRHEIHGARANDSAAPFANPSDDVGNFYLIQLEPEHDPARFKVGFTVELDGRLHTEVFRASDLTEVTARADSFFAMMPTLIAELETNDEADVASAG